MKLLQEAPQDWPRPVRSKADIVGVLVFSFLTLIGLDLASSRTGDGMTWQRAFDIFGILLFANFTVLALNGLRRVRQSDRRPSPGVNDIGETGATFHHAWSVYYWLLTYLGLPAIALIGFAVKFADNDDPVGLFSALACLSGAVFLGWLCCVVVRRGRGKLVLTPSGVYHHSGASDQFTPWESITDVRPWNGPVPSFVIDFELNPRMRTRSAVGRLGSHLSTMPHIVCQANFFRRGTVSAYRVTRYYFENPDRRAELADPSLYPGNR